MNMDHQLFQGICTAVLALAYATMWITTPPESRRRFVGDVFIIGFGAWIAEDTSILRYDFYRYPDWWWLKLDEVPLLVVAIWPVVVLSSRAVLDRLVPGLSGWKLALGVGIAVTIDATLIETIAADARLWRWSEGGYLGVPLIGMLGWGAYAAAITWAMNFQPQRFSLPRWAAPLLALGGTHMLIVAMWWGGLRFFLRGELPVWFVWIAVGALGTCALRLLRQRSPERLVSASIALPRMLASSVFVVLLAHSSHPDSWALWVHLGAVALPYLASVDWRSFMRQAATPTG